jgi:hypothetical protein
MNHNSKPLDVGYLVMGLVFLAVVAVWGLYESELVGPAELEWLLPVGLVVAGVIGLAAAAAKGLAARRVASEHDAAGPAEWAWRDENFPTDPDERSLR